MERCYKVRVITKQGTDELLVKAKSAIAARRHASLKSIEVVEATFEDIVKHGQAGGTIEESVS